MFPNPRRVEYREERKHYLISVEGGVTEREYFERLKKLYWDRCNITVLSKKTESAPANVVEHMSEYRGSLVDGDEKWCVVDKDRWPADQLQKLRDWKSEKDKISRHVAMSNPKFEMWLVAHFRDLPSTSPSWHEVLNAFMPGYDKHIDKGKITDKAVRAAIARGKLLTPSGEPPENVYGTNVWVLVDHIADERSVQKSCSDAPVDVLGESGTIVQDELKL